MMFTPILMMILVPMPQFRRDDVSLGLRQLASPRWATREAGVAWLVRCCERDQDALYAVEAGFDSLDVTVRTGCYRVIKRVVPCSCKGTGWIVWRELCFDGRGKIGYPINERCHSCAGTGSPFLHPRRDRWGWPGSKPHRSRPIASR